MVALLPADAVPQAGASTRVAPLQQAILDDAAYEGADHSTGRRRRPLGIDAAAAQSIFQAEKITLGTAGSPAGFL